VALTSLQIVRLNIGDRGSPPYLSDDEINHFLTEFSGDTDLASSAAASAIAAYFATMADQTTGRMSVSYGARAQQYRLIALDFGPSVPESAVAGVFMGGQSQSRRSASREDTDRVQPIFTDDLHEDPGAQP
jgi:hypothetical protein